MTKITITYLFFTVFTLLNCSNHNTPEEELPNTERTALDYNNMNHWAFHPDKNGSLLTNYNIDIAVIDKDLNIERTISITNNYKTNTGVDVFFVHPTVLDNITDPPQNVDIADQPGFQISGTIIAQGGLLAKYGRLFAPRYRQSTGPTYGYKTDKDLQASIIKVSYNDVKAAFLDYLDNYNNGNKIILAGHSQGSYLLAMLLRDLFDNNENLRSKLVTAALGGMNYIYAKNGSYVGGWWENIPLCTTTNECGCVQNWTTFDDSQALPIINYGLPEFNQNLIDDGFVYRMFNTNEDWFVQDTKYYTEQWQPLRYYITPNASYNLGGNSNFIAFDNLYNVKARRDHLHKNALTVEYAPSANDNRPNDLALEKYHPNYDYWGYHTKDYHIYLWALLEQIDLKLANCM